MRATFNFFTKRTQCCPFEMSSRSPTSPGAFSASEPSQEQLNIRKQFQGLFHISHNPIIMHSLVMSSHTLSLATTMPSMALGGLGVTSPGTAWTVQPRDSLDSGSTGRDMARSVPLAVCTSPALSQGWQQHRGGEVQCCAVSEQRTRALWRPLSSQKINGDKCPRRTDLQSQGEKGFHVLGMGNALRNSVLRAGCKSAPASLLGVSAGCFASRNSFLAQTSPGFKPGPVAVVRAGLRHHEQAQLAVHQPPHSPSCSL